MFGVGRGLGEGGEAQEWRVPPPGLSSPGVPPANLLQPGFLRLHPEQQWVLGGSSSFPVQVQLDFLPSVVPTSHSPQLEHLFFNAVNGHESEDFSYPYFPTSPDVPPAGLLQPGVVHIHPHQQQLNWPMFLPRHQHGVLRGASSFPVQVQKDPLPSINQSKRRLRWTPELDHLFINAVNQLGGHEKATPKHISKIMGVPGLTLVHIKSHLQNYRHHAVLEREAAARMAAERALGEAQAAAANPGVPPARENEVVHEEAAGVLNPTGSLSQSELQFSRELQQCKLVLTTHSREMVRAHTGSSSQLQEFVQNNDLGVDHSSTSTANAGEEWDEVVPELEEDPVDKYLNFPDDAGEDTNL